MNKVNPQKEGRLCCFCFCDMRRAVIILNGLSIILSVIMAILIGTGAFSLYEKAKDDLMDKYGEDDPKTIQQSKELDYAVTTMVILYCIGLATSTLAIYGAVKYCSRYVMIQAAYAIANLIVTATTNRQVDDDVDTFDYGVSNYVGNIFGTSMIVYVHVSLVKEIRQGIMCEEKYESTEAHSCCCLSTTVISDDDDDNEAEMGRTKRLDGTARSDSVQ